MIFKPNKKKTKQIYHINLLKEWKEAPVWDPLASLLVTEVDSKGESKGEEESPFADLNQATAPTLDHLSAAQSSQ